MAGFEKIGSSSAETRRIAQTVLRLRDALDEQIPVRNISDSLLLATFNIREFDSQKYGKRTDESILYLTEIISRFDLVAVQEVRRDLTGLTRLIASLGSWWKYIVTDASEGVKGNDERMAFLYDSRKVKFGSLSGEVVIPDVNGLHPAQQLARTPFIVGFESGWYRFMLCTVHILYGNEDAVDPRRLAEIESIAEFLRKRTEDKYAWSENLVLLGDFNIFSPDDVTMKAITRNGFRVPDKLQRLPSNVAQNKYYDQIAFHSPSVNDQLATSRAGVFNFFNYVLRDGDESIHAAQMGKAYSHSKEGKKRTASEKTRYYRDWRTFQISDHLPMWIELKIDFSRQQLEKLAK